MDSLAGARARLDSRWAPVVAGALTSLLTAWIFGGLREPGDVHDELAYLLQAATYATGRWAAPAPPLPEFFEQYHVLVTPTLSSKYPPGYALLLAPGVALGLPGLGPVLLAGLSGGLLYALARRLGGGEVALVAWLVWVTSPADMAFRASYLSQVATTPLWLGALWLLWDWWESGRRGALLALSVVLAFMALTRPLTAAALALPIAGVIAWRAARGNRLRDVVGAAAAGAVVLTLLPLSSAAVTGDFRSIPYAVHTRTYLPFVRLGFGLEDSPPLRELPRDMQVFNEGYRKVHRDHTLAALPGIAGKRLLAIGDWMWGEGAWRRPFALLALVGLLVGPRRLWLGVASFLCLFGSYLLYAHPLGWMVYYQETQPVLAVLCGLGTVWVAGRIARGRPRVGAASMLVVAALVIVLGLRDAVLVRRNWPGRTSWRKALHTLFARIPDRRAVVFIRYGPAHNPDRAIVANAPDWGEARLWLVYDRGPEENERLLRAAPERVPYLFDEARGMLEPYRPAAGEERSSMATK